MTVKSKTIKHLLCLAIFLLCLGIGTGEAVANIPGGPLPAPTAPTNAAQKTSMQSFYDEYLDDSLCWACPAFSQFYQAGIALAFFFSEQISAGMVSLLGGVFGLWLLWQLAKIFAPFGSMGGVSEIFNAIAGKIVLFIFLLVFIGNFGLVWTWFISPVFNTGIRLSNSLLMSTSQVLNVAGMNDITNAFGMDFSNPTGCQAARNTSFNVLQAIHFPAAVDGNDPKQDMVDSGKSLLCNIVNVQKVFGVGAAMGLLTIVYAGGDYPTSDSWNPGVHIANAITFVAKVIMAVVAGFVLALIYVIAILLYPFYLIDALFKFVIICIVSPILVGAYFLPMTRGWAIAGIKGMVGIAASLIFLSVLVGLSLSMTAATIMEVARSMSNGGSIAAGAALTIIFQKAAFGLAGIIMSKEFWQIFIGFTTSGVIALLLMRKANQLAQEFVGASGGDGVMGAMVQGIKTAAAIGVGVATGGASLVAGVQSGIASRSADSAAANLPTTADGPSRFDPGGGGTGSTGPAPSSPGGGGGIASGFISNRGANTSSAPGFSSTMTTNTNLSGDYTSRLDFLGGGTASVGGSTASGSAPAPASSAGLFSGAAQAGRSAAYSFGQNFDNFTNAVGLTGGGGMTGSYEGMSEQDLRNRIAQLEAENQRIATDAKPQSTPSQPAPRPKPPPPKK